MTAPAHAEIAAAARLLEGGQLVAFPTETVYGLGADAENSAAIARIYAAKGRPSNHPLIVHVAADADLAYWTSALPPVASQLMAAFWPGALTLILPRAAHVPAAVAGGQDSIGLRSPAHPVAQALLAEFKGGRGGIAAPSANRFGRVSPTTAQHVRDEFAHDPAHPDDGPVAAVLDGGQCAIGIESTILDLTRVTTLGPVLLRPGQIDALQLATILGALPMRPDLTAPRASGTLAAHYAPRTPVALVAAAKFDACLQGLAAAGRRMVVMAIGRTGAVPLQFVSAGALWQMPDDPAGYAHELYAALRALDSAGAEVILIEAPPHTEPWQAIHDRLQRAAHDSSGILERLL